MDIPRNWSFENKGIAGAFDQHVREQLPWYDLATQVVAHIARHYIPQGGMIYDIGASTGNIGNALADIIAARGARLVPVESSAEMAEHYRGPQADNLIMRDVTEIEFEPADLAICFLVLMFIPVSARGRLIARLLAAIRPGGAVIIFDKCQPPAGYPATILWRLALAGKLAAEVPADQIVAKELSLSGVQRPLAPNEIPFQAVECFRFGDFAGWIIEP